MDLLAPWLWARYRAHYAGLLVFQLLFWPVFVIGIGMIAWAVCLHRTVAELALVAGTFLVVVELCGAIAQTAGYRTMFATMALTSLAGLATSWMDGRRHVGWRAPVG